jgi:uncharacterized protein (DUF2267 family)
MPIAIRDNVMFILLKKIAQASQGEQPAEVQFSASDFTGLDLTKADLLGHLDYLNQKHYIDAEFSGNAYATQEDVPDLVNPEAVDFRIANTLGAEDGPLPHLITFKRATLTATGQQVLAEMEQHSPAGWNQGKRVPLPDQHTPFLEKVKIKGGLSDIYDARDVANVVFRVMRDVMTTSEADRVQLELHETALPTKEKALQMEIADLWQDTNPIVRFLSRLRPPLTGSAPFGIDSQLFLTRVDNEASVPETSNAEQVIGAVFSATKDELSEERIQAIAAWLPKGRVRQIWQTA